MAKTYNSIPTVSTGDVYTATAHNNIVTNVNNYRVPPMCILAKSISITNAGVTWDFPLAGDEEVDTDDMHSTSVNTTRITIQTAGVYHLNASVQGGAGLYSNALRIEKNGTQIAEQSNDNGTYNTAANVSTVLNLAVNDYITAKMYSTTTATYTCRLSAVWLGQVS